MSDFRDLEVVVTFRPMYVFKTPITPVTLYDLAAMTDPSEVSKLMPEREMLPLRQMQGMITEHELWMLRRGLSQSMAWRLFNEKVRRIILMATREADRPEWNADVTIFWQGERWYGCSPSLRDALFPPTFEEQFAEALADAERANQWRAQG